MRLLSNDMRFSNRFGDWNQESNQELIAMKLMPSSISLVLGLSIGLSSGTEDLNSAIHCTSFDLVLHVHGECSCWF
jgi:hypothetical protein